MRINLFSIAALQYSAFAINIGMQFLLTLLVAPEIFGVYAKLQSTTDIIVAFASVGLHTAVLQLQEHSTEKLFKHSFFLGILQILLLMCVGAVIFSSFYYLGWYTLKEAILGESLLFVSGLLSLKQIVYIVYEKQKNFVFNSKISFYINIIAAIMTIVFVWKNPSIELLIFRVVATNLLLFLIYMYLLFFRLHFNISWSFLDKKLLKQILHLSFRLYLAQLLEILQHRIDIIVVSYLFGNYEIGVYERVRYYALMVFTLLNSLSMRINTVKYRQDSNLNLLYYSHTIILLIVPVLYVIGFISLTLLNLLFNIPAFANLFPLYFCFWSFAGFLSIIENIKIYLQIHYAVIRTSIRLRLIPLLFFLFLIAVLLFSPIKPTIEIIAFLASFSYLSVFIFLPTNLYIRRCKMY